MRGKGDGSLYQRESDGLWVGYVRIPGEKKRKYVYAKTRKEANAKLKALQKSVDAGTVVTAKPENVESFLAYWLSIRRGQKNIRATTNNSHESHLKALLPLIGQVKLTKLTTDQLQQVFNMLLETHKASTVHTTYVILSAALNAAVKWKRLSHNPAKDVELPQAERHDGPVLTGDQCMQLINTAKGHSLEAFFIVALATGLRKGELLALHWSDIDFDGKTLKVNTTLVHVRDATGKYQKVETSPKTRAGKRTIKLAQFAINALKAHRARQLEQRMLATTWIDNDLVFCSVTGEHIALTTLNKAFKNMLNAAGLPDIRIHDLRHASATLLLSMGVDLKTIQEILGHANFQITANIYGHVSMAMQQSAMEKMDSLFLVSM